MADVFLTAQDATDLKAGRSINAGATDGSEVNLYPKDFTAPVWALLSAGGRVTVESDRHQEVTIVGVEAGSS